MHETENTNGIKVTVAVTTQGGGRFLIRVLLTKRHGDDGASYSSSPGSHICCGEPPYIKCGYAKSLTKDQSAVRPGHPAQPTHALNALDIRVNGIR